MKKMMRAALVLILAALVLPARTAEANTLTGASDWAVSFTQDKEMVSNFKTSDLDDVIYGLQPGDEAVLTLKLTNQNSVTTDWYMTNKVLYSLEDRSKDKATAGGAYTYRLVYTNPDGEERVLYDSDKVGGDDVSPAGEGLKEATDALEDYFYLDTLATGKSGKVDLTVALDGETQGNDYQDTLADLQMNFAVELSNEETTTTATSTTGSSTTTTGASTTTTRSNSTTSTSRSTTVVRTGDQNDLFPYFLAAGISGAVLMVLACYGVYRRRKDKEGGAA